MPFISSLKEKFATTTIEDRESVVLNLATANTEDAKYYQGHIILQKIYNEVMKQEEPTKVREATTAEIALSTEMQNHLNKILVRDERYTELYTRFNLLIYPFEATKSIEFIKSGLCLDLLTQKQEQQQVEKDDKSTSTTASILDNDLIDGSKLLKESFENFKTNGNIDVDLLAFPQLKDFMLEQNSMTDEEEVFLLKKLFMYPSEKIFGNDILDRLIRLWKLQKTDSHKGSEGWQLENLPFYNFTLAQLDQLIERIPEIVLLDENFVKTYLEKLVPTQYYNSYSSGESITFWNDDENILHDYLCRLEDFGQKLPGIYFQFKSAVKFYQLRVDIARQDFKELSMIQFLTGASDKAVVSSPIPSRAQNAFSFNTPSETAGDNNSNTQISIDIPLLGYCEISKQDKLLVVTEYLTGLIMQDKLTVSTESLGAYMDYHNVLKPLYAKLMLTVSSTIQESWAVTLGSEQYENLVAETSVSFAPSTLNASVKRKPEDPVHLSVRTKNIQRLSIRVFQINMENYSRLHINGTEKTIADKNNKIDLDGLCPTWEKDIDFSSEPAICVKTNNFVFGDKGLASNVFKGRGLWVIEFVGGQNQCRAIIQKGYLRHIIQESTAGHIVRILDECGRSIGNSKIWCNNQYYQADESDNILIPYLSSENDARTNQMLLISTLDEFCEPASFYQLAEKYQLEAEFYVNREMVSFNKKATVIVNPRLTMNGISVPLSLLEKTSLHIECINVDDVKNSSTYQNVGQNSHAIYFEFMVPDRLTTLNFSLQTKIKSLDGTLQAIDVKYSIHYATPVDNSGVPASVHLRKTADNRYFIHAFGKNGESKKDYEVSLKLKHAFVQYRQVEVTLKTNDEGSIDLGKLLNIQWIEYSNTQGTYKQWLINNEKQGLLPPAICVSADTSFKVACYTAPSSDLLFSLYKVGVREMLIKNVSDFIQKNVDHVAISGLPEGEYMLYLASNNEGAKQIKCTVINGQADSIKSPTAESGAQDRFWNNWVIGNNSYAKQNGLVLHQPLDISNVHITDDNKSVTIQLENWSSKAFIIVTTSTFVPTASESLKRLMDNRSLTRPFAQDNRVAESKSLFLNDKQLGEEYQYVLNRARSEKWVGSNLTKPTLLMYPKKNASTTFKSRQLQTEVVTRESMSKDRSKMKKSVHSLGYGLRCGRIQSLTTCTESSLSFLNHNSPIIVLYVPDNGTITVNHEALGFGGNLLQVVAISGEQVVSKNIVLPLVTTSNSPLFRYNDLRQKSSSNKTFIRSKVIKNLLPGEKLIINTNEYETIDSFEKLFDTIKTISHISDALDQEFGYLKTWPGLNIEKKLKLHEEKVCHELNLWLKRKDTVFFDEFVKPAIKNKVQKSFMDLYLIDGDLSDFSNDIYKYGKLTTVEKTLLATTQSTEFLQNVLRSFKETFDDKKLDDRSDTIFDSILSGSTLKVSKSCIEMDTIQACSSMPLAAPPSALYSTFSSASPAYSPTSPALQAYSNNLNVLAATSNQRSRSVNFGPVNGQVEDDDDDEEFQEAANELREKAKQLQNKVVYEFTEKTSEWVETSYYNEQDDVTIKRFWIDYLEYHLTSRDEQQKTFLSENFVYSISNLTEILYVLSLIDLPFSSETNWTKETTTTDTEENDNNAIQLAICASPTHPLMVFYRTLTESTAPFSAISGNSNNNLMLGQELFVFDKNTPIDSDECIKINPLSTPLDPLVEYGNHIIISNVSGKILTCQVTVQVPTGAVPCKTTPYCKSKTICIDPYSTWHEVTGTFYFPSAGRFTIVPVTVSSLSGNKLLGKIEAIDINVIGEYSSRNVNTNNTDAASQSLSLSSWPTLANTGSGASVIAFLESYKKLDRLDFNMIGWRMKDQTFARQVFNVLSQQRYFFSPELWKYGVYHQFDDIIRDLLNFNSSSLLANVGQTFESPLVCKKRKDYTQVFDYYPLLNARAHPLKSTSHEILNNQFYKQYDDFLTYLSQQTSKPSNTDLVILTLYLILQDRIGDAQSTFARIESGDDQIDCQVQIDYLEAYLKTRIPVRNQTEQQIQDLDSVKEIAGKYKNFGVLKWRKLFAELYEFVCEVEQGDSDIAGGLSQQGTKRIQSEPILEFEINQQHQELVVQYANVKCIDIKYYEMNIEVMFSTNPFMNDRTTSMLNNESFTWIKPSYTSQVDLPEKQQTVATSETEADDDYNMIGVGQVNSVQTLNIPFSGGNKNIFVEISSVGTQHIIKRRQAYFSHSLYTHIAESFGIVRVLSGKTKRPLAGAYVKVYARMKKNQKVHFWKDGYTGLNGVFDYIGVTEGNALMGEDDMDLKSLMNEKIDKLSILIISIDEGAIVKEAYPPLA